MNIQNNFMNDKILCLKKHRTLGARNRQFSSKGGGDFMQFLCGTSYQYIFYGYSYNAFSDTKFCFIFFLDIHKC